MGYANRLFEFRSTKWMCVGRTNVVFSMGEIENCFWLRLFAFLSLGTVSALQFPKNIYNFPELLNMLHLLFKNKNKVFHSSFKGMKLWKVDLLLLVDFIHYFIYRPFLKTSPRSSAVKNWISVRFYETGCI